MAFMKKLILFIALSVSLLAIQCDNKKDDTITLTEVPGSVQTAFNEKYAGATEIKWENAHENSEKTYKVKFTWNGKEMEAEFDASGAYIKGKEK
jgi:hypothetical protein